MYVVGEGGKKHMKIIETHGGVQYTTFFGYTSHVGKRKIKRKIINKKIWTRGKTLRLQ